MNWKTAYRNLPDREYCFECIRLARFDVIVPGEPVMCIYCDSEDVVKRGETSKGAQQYWCKDCESYFNDLTGTIFAQHRLDLEEMIYIINMMDSASVAQIARDLDRDYESVLNFVHEVEERDDETNDLNLSELCEQPEPRELKQTKTPERRVHEFSPIDPKKDYNWAEYILTQSDREVLDEHKPVVPRDYPELRSKAGNLASRIQYLFEDIEYLSRAGVLDSHMALSLRDNIREMDPPIAKRRDVADLDYELNESDRWKVDKFGIGIGHMLSRIYPGDDSTQTWRLWWGMVLGYFGHPLAVDAKDGQGSPERILRRISSDYSDLENSSKYSKSRAAYKAEETVLNIGNILLRDLSGGVKKEIEQPSDDLRALLLAGRENSYVDEHSLKRAYTRLPNEGKTDGQKPDTLNLKNGLWKDISILREIDELVRQLRADMVRIDDQVASGTEMREVIEELWKSNSAITADQVKSATVKQNIRTTKELLSDLTSKKGGREGKKREWAREPPAKETTGGEYELTAYGKLLTAVYFDLNRSISEIYGLGFGEKYQPVFKTLDTLPKLLDGDKHDPVGLMDEKEGEEDDEEIPRSLSDKIQEVEGETVSTLVEDVIDRDILLNRDHPAWVNHYSILYIER